MRKLYKIQAIITILCTLSVLFSCRVKFRQSEHDENQNGSENSLNSVSFKDVQNFPYENSDADLFISGPVNKPAFMITTSRISYMLVYNGNRYIFFQTPGTVFAAGNTPYEVSFSFNLYRIEYFIDSESLPYINPAACSKAKIVIRNLCTGDTAEIAEINVSDLEGQDYDLMKIYPVSYTGKLISFIIEYWNQDNPDAVHSAVKIWDLLSGAEIFTPVDIGISQNHVNAYTRSMACSGFKVDCTDNTLSTQEIISNADFVDDTSRWYLRLLDEGIYYHIRFPANVPDNVIQFNQIVELKLPICPDFLADICDFYISNSPYPSGMDRFSMSPWSSVWMGTSNSRLIAGNINGQSVRTVANTTPYFDTEIVSWIPFSLVFDDGSLNQELIQAIDKTFRQSAALNPVFSLSNDFEIDGWGVDWFEISGKTYDSELNLISGAKSWSGKEDSSMMIKSAADNIKLYLLIEITDDVSVSADNDNINSNFDQIFINIRLADPSAGIVHDRIVSLKLIPDYESSDISFETTGSTEPFSMNVSFEDIRQNIEEAISFGINTYENHNYIELAFDKVLASGWSIEGISIEFHDYDTGENPAVIATSDYFENINDSVPLIIEGERNFIFSMHEQMEDQSNQQQ